MTKTSIWSLIIAACLCFLIPSQAAQSASLPAPPQPVSAEADRLPWEAESTWVEEPIAKIEVAKIRSGLLPGIPIGAHYDGLLKIRQQRYVATGRMEEYLESSVRDLLEDELSQAGFAVLRSHPNWLFEEMVAAEEPGRFLIGGTITQARHNSYSSWLQELTETEHRIRWEVFDRDVNQVVYRQETRGSAQAEGIDNPQASYDSIRASFHTLLQEPRFVALLNQPAPEAVPPSIQPYTINAIAPINQPLTLEQLVGRTIPSIVQILTPTGKGSGFLLDSSGLIVTNEHVVGAAFAVKVRLYDDTLLTGRVLKRDAAADAALVKLEGNISDITGLPICHTDAVRVGQSVVAIGNPLSLSNTVTQGIVSGVRRNAARSLIQTDTAVNPGNSGGPLLNREGAVIGIVTEKIVSDGVEGLGFALPIGEVLQRLNVAINLPPNSELDACGNPLVAYR